MAFRNAADWLSLLQTTARKPFAVAKVPDSGLPEKVVAREALRSMPLKTTDSGTPSCAQPRTRSNAGPTTRTR